MDRVVVRPRGLFKLARLRADGLVAVFIDVDGTMTDGALPIGAGGSKVHKNFGSDDSDAIRSLVARGVGVTLVTADVSARDIVSARAAAMGAGALFVSGSKRHRHIPEPMRTAYIGDGYYDGTTFTHVGFGIATKNALPRTKKTADAVLSRRGGDKAVVQALDFVERWILK